MVRDLGEKTGYETTIVRKMLMTGGYKIYSTLNPDVQAAVEEVYQNLDNIPPIRQARSSCSPALSSLTTRPETSSLLPAAWVKSREA